MSSTRKKKVTMKDMQLEPDPVWVEEEDGVLMPTPFFKDWWERVAERRFGDRRRIIDAAIELGYIGRFRDPETGRTYLDPMGFDYDPIQYRQSLGLPVNDPIVHIGDDTQSYTTLWDKLLEEQE
jgi:hypothetical protein